MLDSELSSQPVILNLSTAAPRGLKASIVVATYNRAQCLPRLIQALNNQTLPDDAYEIIVVDDASTDNTPQVLAELTKTSRVSLTTIRQTRNTGPAEARNLGIAKARAPIVAITDDDCVPTPPWLASGLAIAGAKVIVVGHTEPAEGFPIGPFSRTLKVRDTRHMQTCNIFFARQDLLDVGCFDTRFHTSGEDTEMGLRMLDAGATAVFCDQALVHHDVSSSDFGRALHQAWSKWTDLPLVVKLHPQLRSRLPYQLFWKRSHIYALPAAIALLFAPFHPIAVGASLPWLYFRLRVSPITRPRSARLLTLPGAFLIDVAECFAMIRGSVRHRALLL